MTIIKAAVFSLCIFLSFETFPKENQNNENTNSDAIVLGSASKQGEYFDVANSISTMLNKNKIANIKVLETSGSIDNIRKLVDGEIHLGIAQSDILYKYQNGQLEGFNSNEEIGSIGALFPEYIQIAVSQKNKNKYRNILKLANKKVYIGKDDSGSKSNAIDILNMYQMDIDDIERVETTKDNALIKLKAGEIDAAFLTTGQRIIDPSLHIISFSNDFIKQLTKKYPHYGYQLISESPKKKYELFVRSVLVARYKDNEKRLGVEDTVVKNITESLYTNWFEIEKNTDSNVDFFPKHLIARKVSLDLHEHAQNFYQENDIITPLRMSDSIWVLIPLIAILGIIYQVQWIRSFLKYIIAPFATASDRFPWIVKVKSFYAKCTHENSYIAFFWIIYSIIIIVIFVILYFESSFAHNNDVLDPFASKTKLEIAFWLLTFAVTGFNQNIFPNHIFSQISAILIPVFTVVGAFFVIVKERIQEDRFNDKELRGEVIPNAKGAFIICGWNARVPVVIENLLSNEVYKSNFSKIIILANPSIERPVEKFGLNAEKVKFYRSYSSSYETLKTIQIAQSTGAIIFADDEKIKNDNIRGILTASAINDLTHKNKEPYPIIAEVFHPSNIDYFNNYGVKRIVCLSSYSVRLLLHSIINPGVSDLLLNMLNYAPPYFLEQRTASELGLENISFAQASTKLRSEHNILLLGVYKEDSKVDHSALELNFRKDDSPYFSISKTNETHGYINSDDTLITLKNKKTKSKLNGNWLQREVFEPVTVKNERVVIIGRGIIADHLSKKLKDLVSLLIHIDLDDLRVFIHEQEQEYSLNVENLNDAFKKSDLKSKNITRFIILAPEMANENSLDSVYQDDESLKNIHQVKKYYRNNSINEVPHICAEIRDIKNKDLFFNAGVQQIIATNMLIELVLTRIAFHFGKISGYILKSMSYDKANNLVRIEKWSIKKLAENTGIKHIEKHNFDTLFNHCIEHSIQLLAVETKLNGAKYLIVNPETNQDKTRKITHQDNIYAFIGLDTESKKTKTSTSQSEVLAYE